MGLRIPPTCATLVAIALLSLLWWLPFSIEPPGRDQSLFLAQSQALLDGASLYTEIWEQKPPAIIMAYALAQLVAGRGYHAILLLDWFAGCLTALLLAALLLQQTRSLVAAAGAAALYLAYQTGAEFDGFWGVAQAEVLMDPLLVGMLAFLMAGAASRQRSARRSLAAGLCLAAMLGLKYSALPLALLIVPRMVDRSVEPRHRLIEAAAFAAGVLVPAIVWTGYMQLTGRLALFWEATVTFNLAHAEISRLPRSGYLLRKIFYLLGRWAPLYLFMAVAVALAVSGRVGAQRSAPASERLLFWGGLAWMLGLAQVFWQSKFWNYHYHVVLVPLCILAGVGVGGFYARLSETRLRALGAVVASVSVLWFSMPYYVEALGAYAEEHELGSALQGQIDRSQFLATYRWGMHDYEFLDTMRAAERLRDDTDPRDRVFVWGFEPGIYVYSGRRPATRFFYDYPLMPRFEAVHGRFRDRLMDDLERHQPARIVVVSRDQNDIEAQDSVSQLLAIPVLQRYIVSNYEPAWSQGDFWVLRRKRGTS